MPGGSWSRTSSRTWLTSSLSVAPGSTSDERTWRAVDLLAQRFAEDPDPVLGHLVDAAADADAPARDRADVDEIGHAPWLALGGGQQVGEGGVGDVEQPWRLSAIIRSHSSTGASTISPSSITPALLTTMSSRPSSCAVRSTAATACSRSVTSVSMARPPISRRQRVQPVLAARGDGDRRALLGERARRRLADATARARDERDRVLQCLGHDARSTAGPEQAATTRRPRRATP